MKAKDRKWTDAW